MVEGYHMLVSDQAPPRKLRHNHGRTPVAQRFWEKVQKADGDGCWLWLARCNAGGYGCFVLNQNKPGCEFDGAGLAHRVSYKLANGPDSIPPGILVLHRCDNPRCVRPDHLFTGTQSDNMADMIRKGRGNRSHGETHKKAKLTADDVRTIRSLAASGAAMAPLGRAYGVTPQSIQAIVRRKNWKHVA
jgi:hypothetical protein